MASSSSSSPLPYRTELPKLPDGPSSSGGDGTGGRHVNVVVIVADKNYDPLKELEVFKSAVEKGGTANGLAEVIFMAGTLEEFETEEGQAALEVADVLLTCAMAKAKYGAIFQAILPKCKRLRWIHSVTAGVDHLLTPALMESPAILTNATGLFSSSLAEYALLCCLMFSKDVPRWQRQQKQRIWEKFIVGELRGATMGIVGYGDIGRATGRLAKAFGMKVIALKRQKATPPQDDPADEIVGRAEIGELFQKSDYIVVAAALTPDTENMVGKKELAQAKRSCVLINVGRGPLIDEVALIKALNDDVIRGAALDVTVQEPLPADSPLWSIDADRLFISPHNADMTADFIHKSVQSFAENVLAVARGDEAICLHQVDKQHKY